MTRDELVAELAAMRHLHQLSARLLASTTQQAMLEEFIDATMALLNADFGNVQLYDPGTGALRIAAQRGFTPEFLAYFDDFQHGTGACGVALQRGERVIVEDVLTDERFTAHLRIVGAAGFRAVQATPLLSRDAQPLGVLCTHFRQPHRPSERELRMTDLYAHHAAEMIERKRAEEALRSSEERFRRYFELGLIGMAITSPEKGCLEVNDELCRILGYERSEILQKTWAEMTHPGDVATDVAQFERVMAGEIDGYILDKRWIRKDGRVIDSVMSAKCVRRADGSVEYFVGLILDTTERKRAEEKLGESDQRFRLLVESIPHHFWSYRPDGSLGYWNQRLADYTGLTDDQLRRGGAEALHPHDVVRVEAAWRAAFGQGVPYEVEKRIRGRDGQYRRFVSRAVAVCDEQGRPREWFGTDTDVEDRRRAEEALHKSRTELAHVSRVTILGELAGTIAHEINQPLAAIVTNGHVCQRLLSREVLDVAAARDSIERMIRDGWRASEVLQRIRALLKKAAPERALLNINDILREVLAMVQPELAKNRLSPHVALADGLPPVLGDRVQLQQVVLNLILNANEAMGGEDADQRELLIASRQCGPGEVTVSVRDSGAGVDPEKLESIFESFVTSKPGGLGLGLSISRTIIEAHGGRIWAALNEDRGVTVQFTLPARWGGMNDL
ncbi:MAG: PAS domain S-box protein [Candidatus Binatia bacterium]